MNQYSSLSFFHAVIAAFMASLGMLWLMLWALILGFALSGAVQAFVSKDRMASLLGRSGPREIGLAAFFGAVSSSCSYAAASMARSIFEKGANIICALAFMLASTNLVLELSVVLWVLLGWRFVVAEFLGGCFLIVIMSCLMRLFAPLGRFAEKQKKLANTGQEKNENESGNEENGNESPSPLSWDGWAQAAQSFVMEAKMIWKDILIGVIVSGFIMVFVPETFWQKLFLQSSQSDPGQAIHGLSLELLLKMLENAFVGPLVAMLSFVCSVGNIPLAATLYRGGISFGGAISFIYGDLIVIPLILIYRKYYGWRLAIWISGIFYIAMALSGFLVDLIFTEIGAVPASGSHSLAVGSMPPINSGNFFQMNYTFWLNIIFIGVGTGLFFLAQKAKKEEVRHCCH